MLPAGDTTIWPVLRWVTGFVGKTAGKGCVVKIGNGNGVKTITGAEIDGTVTP